MNMNQPACTPTLADAAGLPPTLGLLTAAVWLGIGRTTAYRLAEHGEFPVPVLRIGRSYRVPSAPLIALLAIPANPSPNIDADTDTDTVG